MTEQNYIKVKEDTIQFFVRQVARSIVFIENDRYIVSDDGWEARKIHNIYILNNVIYISL